jgi:hypothetical protein
VLCLWVIAVAAAPTCLAQQVMTWQGSNFPAISLNAISTVNGVSTGSATLALTLNGNVQISADNSVNAELRGPGGAALVTEYALSFDGNGTTASGGTNVPYTPYSSFLNPPAPITYVQGDNQVSVTLSVRASQPAGTLLDAGSYTAQASLTVTWVGP